VELAIVMLIAYIPFFYWIVKEAYESSKPKKRSYGPPAKQIKADDNWLW
jgi:hypothetical protein